MTAAELSLINELYQLSRSVSPEDSATFNSKCQAAVPTLLNVIKTQADDVELLRTCICILKEHCYDSDTNSAYLPTTDALPLVLSAVQRHASNVGLVLQVLGLFVNLTVLDANRTIIGNAGGIALTSQMMTKFPEDREIQKMGMMVLRNISCDNPQSQQEIAKNDGVEVMFNAIQQHDMHPELMEQFVATLLHVSHSEEGCRAIAQQGIKFLLSLLQNPTDNAVYLLEEAVAVLVNLSLMEETQAVVVEDGAPFVLVRIIRDMRTHSTLVRRAVQVLGNLACNDELRDSIVSQGALRHSLELIHGPHTDANAVRICMWALCNFIAGNENAQDQLAHELGGVDAIINAMQSYHAEVDINLHCCKALWTLCYTYEELQEQVGQQVKGAFLNSLFCVCAAKQISTAKGTMTRTGNAAARPVVVKTDPSRDPRRTVMMLLLTAMQEHSQQTNLVHEMSSLLVNLSLNTKTHKEFHNEDGVQVLTDVIKIHRDNPGVISRCCRTLINVMDQYTGMVDPDPALVEAILDTMNANCMTPDVQMKACKLLALLSGRDARLAEAISGTNGVEVLVGCATANWENHDLLKYYISVLLNVSMSKNTHIALTTEGGMDLVVRAMRQFPAAQDVQFRCCRILGNLISNKVALLQDDWHLLLDAMRTHRADPDIQIVCGWILDELSIDEAKLPALHELGTVNCILSALSTHKDNVPVHQHCLEVLVNYSSSPQRSHRQLLSDAALETVLADLSIMPPSVLILCFRILGNMADMHQALLQENGALETITRALATYPAEQQMQADGVGCLCKIATATGKWSVIAHPNTVDALVALQASNPHPSLAISCAAAFFALARIPVGADCIVQNGGVPALLRAVQVTVDPVVQCPCILALAQVCVRAPQDLLPPLGDLSLQLLQVPQGARQLACACVLTATLVVRGLKGVFTEKAPRRLLMALDQYRSQSSACDYNNLRLMAGYVLCALLVHDPNAQARLLGSKGVTDFMWRAGQDLQSCPDVCEEFGITAAADDATMKEALDILMAASGDVEPATQIPTPGVLSIGPAVANAPPLPDADARKSHRDATAKALGQRDEREARDYDVLGKQQRQQREPGPRPEGVMFADPGAAPQAPAYALPPEATSTATQSIVRQPEQEASGHLRPMLEEQEQRDQILRSALKQQVDYQTQTHLDRMRAARWIQEEAEAWGRYQVEVDEHDGRRRITVRMAQHKKAIEEREAVMVTLLQSWQHRLQDETATTCASEDELRQGADYLKAAATHPVTRRAVPPKPPRPVDELPVGGSRAPGPDAPEPGAPAVPDASPRPEGAKGAAPGSGKRRPKVHNVVGWETLVGKSRPAAPAAAAGGQWTEEGELVHRRSPSNGEAAGAVEGAGGGGSTLPGYIYVQKGAKSAESMTNFRAVAVPSALPNAEEEEG